MTEASKKAADRIRELSRAADHLEEVDRAIRAIDSQGNRLYISWGPSSTDQTRIPEEMVDPIIALFEAEREKLEAELEASNL
jgi:hypothetical protein